MLVSEKCNIQKNKCAKISNLHITSTYIKLTPPFFFPLQLLAKICIFL